MNRRTLRRFAILGTYTSAIHAGQTAVEIAVTLDVPLRRIRKDLRDFEDEGVVESRAGSLPGHPPERRYWLTGAGGAS